MKKLLIIMILIFPFLYLNKNTSAASISYGQVETNGSNLNVRSSASTSSKILGKLQNESIVKIEKETTYFYYIKSKNIEGYASKSYINKLNVIATYTTSNLNVRSGPSTSYSILKVLPKNSLVYTLNNNSFTKIIYDDYKIGYVSKNYLSNYKTISLDVPYFMQTDSRWKDVKLGNSTIGKIGCATTSLAMSESYKNNETITPLMQKNKSSYTESGAIYWPSDYKIDYTSSYLAKIYQILLENKPVILHVKNNLSSHFVIVKGFSGTTLSSSNFIILDPTSKTRTTIKDLMINYPTYQKILYY